MMLSLIPFAVLATLASRAAGHISIWHPSMYGFNVTQQTFPYDNRPVAPLMAMTFNQWWFHGHLDHPPNPGDVFDLQAGQTATTELGCNKGATSFFASSEGGNIQSGDDPCPGSPMSEYHTTGPDDLKGCALAIAYKSDVNTIQPEDFTVFSVNHTCVFTRFTDFQVPARMPSCPEGGCHCAWFWIHSPDSGGEQNYMNGFKCNITGSTSDVALATPQVPRRCGADPDNGKIQAAPGNCTYGAKQPFYWFQTERNNMFEGTYAPPFYTDLYNFQDGAQNDIFQDSYPSGIPPPSPNSTVVPTPFLGNGAVAASTSLLPSVSSVQSAAPSSSISASTTSVGSTSGSLTPSVSPFSTQEVSTLISTATVVSTLLVTVTATPSSSFISSSGSSPATIFSTTVVTVTATPSLNFVPSSGSSPATSTTVVTITATSNASGIAPFATSGSSSPTTIPLNNPSSAQNTSVAPTFALTQLDTFDVNSTTSVTPSPTASSSASSAKMCKRVSQPSTLNKRSDIAFALPGMRSHRKLVKKSSLWHIF